MAFTGFGLSHRDSGFSLAYSHFELRSKILSLGKAQISLRSFGFSLAYSYLCNLIYTTII